MPPGKLGGIFSNNGLFYLLTKPPSCINRTGVSQRMKNEEERVCLFQFGLPMIRNAQSTVFPNQQTGLAYFKAVCRSLASAARGTHLLPVPEVLGLYGFLYLVPVDSYSIAHKYEFFTSSEWTQPE